MVCEIRATLMLKTHSLTLYLRRLSLFSLQFFYSPESSNNNNVSRVAATPTKQTQPNMYLDNCIAHDIEEVVHTHAHAIILYPCNKWLDIFLFFSVFLSYFMLAREPGLLFSTFALIHVCVPCSLYCGNGGDPKIHT